MFVDTEGEPIQELAAIEMDTKTCEIKDVFHNFANCTEPDSYSRLHIHGLNTKYLEKNGFPTEGSLIIAFKQWLQRKRVVKIVANSVYKEVQALS